MYEFMPSFLEQSGQSANKNYKALRMINLSEDLRMIYDRNDHRKAWEHAISGPEGYDSTARL